MLQGCGSWCMDITRIKNLFKRVHAKKRVAAGQLKSWSEKFIGNSNTKLWTWIATELILRLGVDMEPEPLSAHERSTQIAQQEISRSSITQDDHGAPTIQVALSEGGGADTQLF